MSYTNDTGLSLEEIRRLETTGVIQLQTAARMAGLRFKNGNLDKAGIIRALAAFPTMGRAALAAIGRMEQGEKPRAIPVLQPVPIPSDWTDDDDEPVSKAQTSPPSGASHVSPATVNPATVNIDLSEYAKRREVHAWLEGYATTEALQGSAKVISSAIAAVDSRLSALAKEIDNLRPLQIKIGDGSIPPIDIPGLIHPKFPKLLAVLMAGENAFLKGPASSGKTTAAKQAREVLAAAFGRDDYQCKAIGAVSDSFALIGYKNATGEYIRTAFREAVEYGHLFLWDEIDASASDAVLVVNSLDNGFVAFPDREVTIHPHFRLICGGNTDGSGATIAYAGRSPMDGAFRDRFCLIDWQIDPRIEEALSRGNSSWLAAVRAIRGFAEKREILDVVATARATRRGPLLLAQGCTPLDVLEMTCKRGSLVDCWAEILRLPAVSSFLHS